MKARVDDRSDEQELEALDVAEHGRTAEGETTSLDRRLYMQLHAFGGASDTATLVAALEAAAVVGTLYEDANDPTGVALLTMSETPGAFVSELRSFLQSPPFAELEPKPELTMLGRTYAIGYEPDLPEAILHRPRRTVLNKDWPWAVWYPLRRSGRFAQLPPEEQRVILAEHGAIGMSYGAGDYAHDIRLACHGLDKNDNDFVIGLLGKELFPLSHIVQAMRKTQQTSLYLDRLGPFFVGRAAWQSAP